MNKTINIPHKKVQPSPQFKPLVAGEGVTLEELNQRITEISATGGGGGGQRIVVSPDMPTDLKENDFWYEEKALNAYSLTTEEAPYPFFLITGKDEIEFTENDSVTIDGTTYPISQTEISPVALENMGVVTSEFYEMLQQIGADVPESIIGQYAVIAYPIFLELFVKKGMHTVCFTIDGIQSSIAEYEKGLYFSFFEKDYSHYYLIINDELSSEQLSDGTFTVLDSSYDPLPDYSQYFSFENDSVLITPELAEEYGFDLELIGLYVAPLTISSQIPANLYFLFFECEGYSTIDAEDPLFLYIIFNLYTRKVYNDSFLIISSFEFSLNDLQISVDNTRLTAYADYYMHAINRELTQAYYETLSQEYTISQNMIGCRFWIFSIDNMMYGPHFVLAENNTSNSGVNATWDTKMVLIQNKAVTDPTHAILIWNHTNRTGWTNPNQGKFYVDGAQSANVSVGNTVTVDAALISASDDDISDYLNWTGYLVDMSQLSAGTHTIYYTYSTYTTEQESVVIPAPAQTLKLAAARWEGGNPDMGEPPSFFGMNAIISNIDDFSGLNFIINSGTISMGATSNVISQSNISNYDFFIRTDDHGNYDYPDSSYIGWYYRDLTISASSDQEFLTAQVFKNQEELDHNDLMANPDYYYQPEPGPDEPFEP